MIQRYPLALLCLTLVGLPAAPAMAQDPCPDPRAPLQLILQRERIFWTTDLFAGQIREPEIVVEPGFFQIYVGIVSQLPPEGEGIYGWNIIADVTGDLWIVDADVVGTVGAKITDDPPGLVRDGFGVARIYDRQPYGRFVINSVVFSNNERLPLDPVGTLTAFRLTIAADASGRGVVRILKKLRDAEGGEGGSLLPCCSQGGVNQEILDFDCAQQVEVRIVDTSHRCATPPADAEKAFGVEWEKSYGTFSTCGPLSIAKTADGGTAITGQLCGSNEKVFKIDETGAVVWQKSFEREESVLMRAIAASSDGGLVLTGQSFSPLDGKQQLYLAKLLGDGSLEWDRLIGKDESSETGRAVAETRDGGWVVAGTSGSALYLVRADPRGGLLFPRELGDGVGLAASEDPISGALVLAGERGTQATVLKTDAQGDPLWERTIPPEAPYTAALFRDVLVTAEGDYLAAGSFRIGTGGIPRRSVVLLAAFGPDGTPLWRRTLDPNGLLSEAHSLAATPDGGYLVAGLAKLLSGAEFFLAKFDASRNLRWQSTFGERTADLSEYRNADFVVTGEDSAVFVGSTSGVPRLLRLQAQRTRQLPSDITQDGRLDLSDGVCLLGFLFGPDGGFLLPCGDGRSGNPANRTLLDGNLDGRLDISDAILILSHLFLGGRPPALGKECIPIDGCPGICPP